MRSLRTEACRRPRAPHGRRPGAPPRSSGGFTLLEVLIATTVLLLSMGFAALAIGASARQQQAARELEIAHQAAEEMMAELSKRDFTTLFADFNGTALDDGADSPGAHFDVPGLDPARGDADGRVGRVEFPVTAAAPGVLREDLVDARLGLPMDLDLDGALDAGDKSASYAVLPVRVEVLWRSSGAESRVVIEGVIGPW